MKTNPIKSIITFLLIFLSVTTSFSQSLGDGCASRELTQRQLKKLPWYGNNNFLNQVLETENYKKDSTQVLYRIPITLWVFSPNSNDEYYKKLIQDVNYYNKLNNTGFEFYYAQIIPKYKSTPFKLGYTIPAFIKGFFYRKKETVNVLLVDNLVKRSILKPTKYYKGQYNSGTKNIVLRYNSSTTSLTHEIGHFLGLHHPHRGWKRGKRHQESVNRERKAQRILKNAKNCELNGDAICDTPAEPVLLKYINTDCQYTGDLVDNWGDKYVPNTDNIMSYPGNIKCRDNFTQGQIAVMLYTAKKRNVPEWKASDIRFIFDQYEPNNSHITASLLNNKTIESNLHLKYAGKSKKIIATDEDWFVIQTDSLESKEAEWALKIELVEDSNAELTVETNPYPQSIENKMTKVNKQNNTVSLDLKNNKQLYICIKNTEKQKELLAYKISLVKQ